MKINRGLAPPQAIAFSLILHELFSLTFQLYESAEDELRLHLFTYLFLLDSQRLDCADCEAVATVGAGALRLNCEACRSERVMPGPL